MRRAASVCLLSALVACGQLPVEAPATAPTLDLRASPQPQAPAWPAVDVLLLGEQHDADDHGHLQQQAIARLTEQGRLAALVLEMAESGHDTRGLPVDADEATVQQRLNWSDHAWPWPRYRAAIMTAVRAGVVVWGGNLPRSAMGEAMQTPSDFKQQHRQAWQALLDAVRSGHCDLLPESQLAPMTRIQVAKDQRMAEVAAAAAQAEQTVVLLAGAMHANANMGVPLHLPAHLSRWAVGMLTLAPSPQETQAFDAVWLTRATPARDHCAELRQRWGKS